MKLKQASLIIVAAGSVAAATEHRWHVELSNPTLSPSTPSTVVTLSAGFPASDWALNGIIWSTRTSEAGWEPGSFEPLIEHPGQQTGILSPDGRTISEQMAGQLYVFGFWPDPANPLPVWRGTFTVTDFSRARDIALTTITDRLVVYAHRPSHPDPFMPDRDPPAEAAAVIRVVPAPATLAILTLGALAAGRRHRAGHHRARPGTDGDNKA